MLLRYHFPNEGLGDASNFAHILHLYVRRAYDVRICCPPDRQIVFAAALVGMDPTASELPPTGFPEQSYPDLAIADQYWRYNKVSANLGMECLPCIGEPEQLWKELCELRLRTQPFISRARWKEIERRPPPRGSWGNMTLPPQAGNVFVARQEPPTGDKPCRPRRLSRLFVSSPTGGPSGCWSRRPI